MLATKPTVHWLYPQTGSHTVIVLIHGAGQSSSEFAPLAALLGRHGPAVAAFDLLGHGNRPSEPALTASSLLADAVEHVYASVRESGALNVILVGHSMGACVAVHAAAFMHAEAISGGLASGSEATDSVASPIQVVAVVAMELVPTQAQSALDRLAHSPHLRPAGFLSMEEACLWAERSGMIKDTDLAASLVLPGMLRLSTACSGSDGSKPTGAGTSREVDSIATATDAAPAAGATCDGAGSADASPKFVWKVDLATTSKGCWEEILMGHTERFLALRLPKLLMLSVTHNTDEALLTAQMQGKFAVRTVPFASHLLHADAPRPCSQAIIEFLARCGVIELRAARGSAFAAACTGTAAAVTGALRMDLTKHSDRRTSE